MKRKLIAFLMAFFTIFSTLSVKAFCADEDTEIVSFNNIKSIMLENSIDMKIADNNLKNTKQELQKVNDDIEDLGYKGSTINKSIRELEDKIEDYEDRISSLDRSDEDYESNKKNIEDEKTSLEKTVSQLKSYKQKRVTAQRNLKKAELTYDQIVENAVFKAQQSYVDCLSIVSQLDNKMNMLKYNIKKSEINKLKYESGFISKNDYEESLTDNGDSENEIIEIKNKQEIALKNLKFTLGLSLDEDINLSNNLDSDLKLVSEINYYDDLQEMLENSIDISIADLELKWAEDDDDEEEDEDDDDHDYENYTLENKELPLDKQYITSEINFKEKYNNLMAACQTIKSSYDKLQQSQDDYVVSSRKYSYGFITKNELEKAKLDLDNKMSDFNTDRNDFYLKYLDYTQMKEGY